MDSIWWNQITKARVFVDDIVQSLLSGKNVALYAPAYLPWRDTFYELVQLKLSEQDPGRTVQHITDPDTDVGEFLIEKFCKREKRATYRPSLGSAKFLARSDDIVLNEKYVWVNGISAARLGKWVDFVEEYRREMPDYLQPGVFILELAPDDKPQRHRNVRCIEDVSFSDAFDAYDRFVFCTLASAGSDVPARMRRYYAELAAELCGEDVELCAQCMQTGERFLQDPCRVVRELCADSTRSDGAPMGQRSGDDKLETLLWKCQLKLLFPMLEEFRMNFIAKHEAALGALLPMLNEQVDGEQYADVQDIELGKLSWLAGSRQLEISEREHNALKLFKDARNSLAHLKALTYEEVDTLLRNAKQ